MFHRLQGSEGPDRHNAILNSHPCELRFLPLRTNFFLPALSLAVAWRTFPFTVKVTDQDVPPRSQTRDLNFTVLNPVPAAAFLFPSSEAITVIQSRGERLRFYSYVCFDMELLGPAHQLCRFFAAQGFYFRQRSIIDRWNSKRRGKEPCTKRRLFSHSRVRYRAGLYFFCLCSRARERGHRGKSGARLLRNAAPRHLPQHERPLRPHNHASSLHFRC